VNQNRKAQILGVGILTPALTGHPQVAAARSVDFGPQKMAEGASVASHDAAIALLQEAIFALTPADKLAIGGDRIRLSYEVTKPKSQNPPAQRNVAPKGAGGAQGTAAQKSLSIMMCGSWRCTNHCVTEHPCSAGCY
jgi:hypothetical protein